MSRTIGLMIGGVTIGAIALLCVVLSGALFPLWPTSWRNQSLAVTADDIRQLQALRSEPKFLADRQRFYPGAASERDRTVAEARVDDFLDGLLRNVRSHPSKAYVLAEVKLLLATFPLHDSEDRDRLAGYVEQTLAIFRIDSSNELLNVWRYGIPYGWMVRRT